MQYPKSTSEINQLIEALRLEKLEDKTIIYDLEEHLARLHNSIHELNFKTPVDILASLRGAIGDEAIQFAQTELLQHSIPRDNKLYKLRIIYSKTGDIDINIEPYTRDLNKDWKIKLLRPEEFHIDSTNPIWRHKFYPRLDFSQQLQDHDEIIWTNEQGYICEGSFTNVFFRDDNGQWHTPSLECNILPGVMRAKLIKELNAIEGFYKLENLQKANEIKLSNSLIQTHSVITSSITMPNLIK